MQKKPNKGKIYEYNPRTAFRLSLHLSEYQELYKNELTVTYPEEFPMNGEIVRKHRDLLLRWLKYHGNSENGEIEKRRHETVTEIFCA